MWAMRVPLWDLSWRHVMTHVNSKTNARLGGGGGEMVQRVYIFVALERRAGEDLFENL